MAAHAVRDDPEWVRETHESPRDSLVAAHVLEGSQPPARTQHATRLPERAGDVVNGTKHQREHDDIEARGLERQ
jgi:hypothetical protein